MDYFAHHAPEHTTQQMTLVLAVAVLIAVAAISVLAFIIKRSRS